MLCWDQTHLSSGSCSSVQHITFLTSEVQKDTLKKPIKIFVQVLLEQVTARIPMDEKCWSSEICISYASIFQRCFTEAPKLFCLHNEWADWKSSNNERLQKKKWIHLCRSLHSIKHLYLVMKQKGWFLSYLKMRQQTMFPNLKKK